MMAPCSPSAGDAESASHQRLPFLLRQHRGPLDGGLVHLFFAARAGVGMGIRTEWTREERSAVRADEDNQAVVPHRESHLNRPITI
jgi:hypothetical protein